jgi:hypothetical protein
VNISEHEEPLKNPLAVNLGRDSGGALADYSKTTKRCTFTTNFVPYGLIQSPPTDGSMPDCQDLMCSMHSAVMSSIVVSYLYP